MIIDAHPRTGGAYLLLSGPFDQHYRAEATLELTSPPIAGAKPSLQMALHSNNGALEAGIVRSDSRHLHAFVSTNKGRRVQMHVLKSLSEGPHQVNFSGDSKTVVFSLDGNALYTFSRAGLIFGKEGFLSVGTSVEPGAEQAAGTISEVRIMNDLMVDPAIVTRPSCILEGGGVRITKDGSRWVVAGTYDGNDPQRQDC